MATYAPALPVTEGVEYRLVEGWPNYAVGSDGSVWSMGRKGAKSSTGVWRRLKPAMSGNYPFVILSNGSKRRPCRVHVLVLEAFHGPSMGRCARHLDDDKLNNQPSNLVWGTPRENSQDAIRNGRYRLGASQTQAKLTDAIVREARSRRKAGESFKSIAASYGVGWQTIAKATQGQTWKHVA